MRSLSTLFHKTLAVIAVAALVASCGGGEQSASTPTVAQEFVAGIRAQGLSATAAPRHDRATLATSATADGVTPDLVLDWAEYKFPDLFPRTSSQRFPAVVYEGATYNARAYAGPWGTRYLGITADGRVFGLGDFTGNALKGFETVSFWAPQVSADRCLVNVANCPAADEQTLTASTSNSALLLRSGDVLVWGSNAFGVMLGSGVPVADSPARRLSLDATSVSAGGSHFIAVKRDGSVVGWGLDQNGVLGDSNGPWPRLVPSPVALPALTDVRSAVATGSAGKSMTTALKNDGSVWHLPGTVTTNVLPFGTTVTPRQVPGLSGVQRLFGVNAAFGDRPAEVLALKDDGSVAEITYFASIGLGGTTYTAAVTPIAGLGAVRSLSCSPRHCLFLLSDGRVFASGSNSSGELGSGSTASSSATPVQVVGLSRVRSVAAGFSVSAAVGEDGRLWTWGAAQYSGRADAGGSDARAPVLVQGIGDAVEVTAGFTHFLLRRTDGTVWGWGSNSGGAVGADSASGAPVRVPGVQRD